MVAATAVADLAAQALKEVTSSASSSHFQSKTPPEPLPPGWIMKEARSQPNAYYYYNQVTGETSWDPPASLVAAEEERKQQHAATEETPEVKPTKKLPNEVDSKPIKAEPSTKVKNEPSESSSRKRSHDDHHYHHHSSSSHKAVKTEDGEGHKKRRSSASSSATSQVRVLHILKKHKDSRRPSSWRSNNQPITLTRDEVVEELQGLLEILQEEEGNPDNLIATFKELASQESDCSSAKRHGDLGFFGRKKMRPEFETAAFGLDVNQLSGIVETASGAHILLRLE